MASNHGHRLRDDLEKDAVASTADKYEQLSCVPQGSQVPRDLVPLGCQLPPEFQERLVDVVVICAKEDFDKVDDGFVPWLRGLARNSNLPDARIHLYDDPEIFPADNLFRQTEQVSGKCMKILAFITDNFLKDKVLTGMLEELIFLTRFMDEDETRRHIKKMLKTLNRRNIVNYLSECVLRQRENALIPVQTADGSVKFTGLLSIRPIQFHEMEKNKKFKERRAMGVIKAAMDDRKKQEYINNVQATSGEHPPATSREHPHSTSRRGDHVLDVSVAPTDTQLISNSTFPQIFGTPLKNQLNNEDISNDDSSDQTSKGLPVTSNQSNSMLVPTPSEVKEKKTENDVIRTANSDWGPEASNSVEGNGPGIAAETGQEYNGLGRSAETGQEGNGLGRSAETGQEGNGLGQSAETGQEGNGLGRSAGTSQEGNGPGTAAETGQEGIRLGRSAETGSTENGTLGTPGDNQIPVLSDPVGPSSDSPEDDIEIDELESSRDQITEQKTIALSRDDSVPGQEQSSQRDESKPVKNLEGTSLDNTGLVNDSGDAAQVKDSGSANLDHTGEESILCVDAQKLEGDTHLNHTRLKSSKDDDCKVMEHALSYRGPPEPFARGLMAGNLPPKDFAGGHEVGSDPPDPTTHMDTGNGQPPGYSHGLYPFPTGTNYEKMPVLTIVHHHHYEKSEPLHPPPQPPQPAQPSNIYKVYGANTVIVGDNNQAIMSNSTAISKKRSKSGQPKLDALTPKETTQKDMQSDSGPEPPSGTPTTSTGSFNNLSPSDSLQLNSTYNFPQSAELTNEWKTDHQNEERNKSAHQTEEGKNTDSSSDEDNSSVSTHRTGDLPGSLDGQLWQLEAEESLGPPLMISGDLESLAASEYEAGPSSITGELAEAEYGETSAQVSHAEWQTDFVGESCSNLFASTLVCKQQFHIAPGTRRTNPLGMMAQCPISSQIDRTGFYNQDEFNDID